MYSALGLFILISKSIAQSLLRMLVVCQIVFQFQEAEMTGEIMDK